MTGDPTTRALPLRAPVLDGECLDSWLEALARRNGISVLLPAFGWKPPSSAARLSLEVAPTVLRGAEQQAGLPARRLDKAVLDPYLRLGPVRRDGSRYCPQCLAARDGRWTLSWRLPWSFACTVHGTVLLDNCPACGRAPRRNLSWAGLNPAGTCPAPVGEGKRCEASPRAAPAERAGSALLGAQQWISALTASAASGDGDAARALGDLPVIAGWQRLHRFREAMAYPSVSAAAQQIGAHPSALIHQFQRLERDIGATLYHRSSPGHPMRPTARGNALLQALGHPAVRALAPPQPDASQPADQDPPPC
jgi:TniQ/Bacterial regulatory helix-turn-helix protein, lysR family